jgi:hypothetical protein
MTEKLRKLYNTMCLIETKGESTKIMTDCLRYVEQLISENNKLTTVKNDVDKED